jgi:multiple sugar transport system permease protein
MNKTFVWILLLLFTGVSNFCFAAEDDETIILRAAWGIPDTAGLNVDNISRLRIIESFMDKYPNIKPVSSTGLNLQTQRRNMDVVPMMQIAGDIAPHILYVNFRQSHTYISSRFLYPLDQYIYDSIGLENRAGVHLLKLDPYLEKLKTAPGYEQQLEIRVPYQCWQVMRRKCPYGEECPYLEQWGEPSNKEHYHIWAFPQGPLISALFYRKELFQEAGLPDRVPATMTELMEWARKIHNPPEAKFGMRLFLEELSYDTLSFLYSLGGRLVAQDEEGNWRCVFDSEEAVEAYYFVARLFLEPFENEHGRFTGVVNTEQANTFHGGAEVKVGMHFGYLDQRFFAMQDPAQWGFGPVPTGPTGERGSEFNSNMVGMYAGIEDKKVRDATWKFIKFYDGLKARLIRTEVFVEHGQGRYVQPYLLKKAGYPEYIRQIPPGWEKSYQIAIKNGIPEPYGRNCQGVYRYASKAIDQIRTDPEVREAIQAFDEAAAKERIREILDYRVRRSNEKMLNILSPEKRRFRHIVATLVVCFIFVLFVLVFRHVFKVFTADQAYAMGRTSGGLQLSRYGWAYLLMLPAIGSILLWAYYPLLRGSLMAFQNYNVRGFSEFVGIENFASVLFDDEFWFSMWVSLKYATMFLIFGFCAPIILAFLLTEVPKGKVVFRTIYYLPAVLSGVIVIFLWKGFYGPYGMINQVLNFFAAILNHLPYVDIGVFRNSWLDNPRFALFFCLLPTVWAGMGPGCLIYLAALKTVPDEFYEAADIDGAGLFQKVFHVALPGIKGLVIINFIGAMVGVMKTGGEFILAMTGGGPYTPYGETEVVGLHIFWQAFGFLRFGSATAMAWVLGSMLIGFTVMQLQRLSRMEFKTASRE